MKPVVFFVDLDRPHVGEARGEACVGEEAESWSRIARRVLDQEGVTAMVPPIWWLPGWWRAARFDLLREAMSAHLGQANSPVTVVLRGELAFTLPIWSDLTTPVACILVLGCPDGRVSAAQVLVCAAALSPTLTMHRKVQALVVERELLRPACAEGGSVFAMLAKRAPGVDFKAQAADLAAHGEPVETPDLDPALGVVAIRELQQLLMAAARSGQPLPATAVLPTKVLSEARIALEGHLLEEGFARQRRNGAALTALADVEHQILTLQSDQEQRSQQLQIVTREVSELKDRLRDLLGVWCSLDELGEKGEKIREQVRHMQAIRASWTYRIVMSVGWPVRVLHGAWMRLRGARNEQ